MRKKQDSRTEVYAHELLDARRSQVPFCPRIDTRDIFRELIAEEIRTGRLTRRRRRRIIQYAAQLGLSGVEAGRLIATCRDQALTSCDAAERDFALKIVTAEPAPVPRSLKLALVLAAILLLDFVVVRFLW